VHIKSFTLLPFMSPFAELITLEGVTQT